MNEILVLLTSILGVTGTYFLHTKKKVNVVTASASTSLIFALVIEYLLTINSNPLLKSLPKIFFGASFVGMSNDQRLRNYQMVILSSVIYFCVYITLVKTFTGFGGGLGTMAFISVLLTLLVEKFIRIVSNT